MRQVTTLALLLAACADSTAPPPVLESIGTEVARIEGDLIAFRRELHQHPELSGQELETAARIADKLRASGLDVRTDVGGHGVIGTLHGALPGPTLLYRADMDAMPADEPAGRPYGSRVPGVFHICGHDAHSAIGVGVARVLATLRERLPGSVEFLFQPAEETLQGAQAMLEDGALEDPPPDAVYAVHTFPFPVGSIARDVDFGGLDSFEVSLLSEPVPGSLDRALARLRALGTAARPGPDDVSAYLDQLLAEQSPLQNAVYMALETEGEGAGEHIKGSLKASDDAEYPRLRNEIRGILDAELGASGFVLDFRDEPFPSMRSDRAVSARALPALVESVGAAQVLDMHAMHLFSGEDFALLLQRAPGAMFLIGVANPERGILGAPHFPDFDLDESAIPLATRAMSLVLWQRLSGS